MRYLLPAAAVILLAFAVLFVIRSRPVETPVAPPAPPPRSPFERAVAAAGLVESSSENILVGSPTTGVVEEVFVEDGEDVRVDTPLFRLDDRSLQAELRVRQATLEVAVAEQKRLQAMPRGEEVPRAEARVRQEKALVVEKEDNYRRLEKLVQQDAVPMADFVAAEQDYKIAEAQLEYARADLDLLLAGAWAPELAAAAAAVAKADSEVAQTRTEIERLTIRARVDARVLQVNIHPGEFVTAFGTQALVVLGSIRELHVRVDIDENDIPRFHEGAPAVAMLKGRSDVEIPLEFVRVQPYVIPKKSLTGENTERVDTRVLQVIYAIQPTEQKLYVGQQLDVFIEAS